METRWHVPKGKDLSTLKIDDRKKELHASKESWSKITDHLLRNERIAIAKEAEESKRRALKDGSYQMTRNWPDSVENMRAKRDAQEELMMGKEDDQFLVRFMELKKEQETERNLYVEKMKEKIMQRKDYPKAITSAFLLSQCMFEREKQIEHKHNIRKHCNDEESKFHSRDVKEDEEFRVSEEEKKKRRKAVNQEFAKDLLKQIEDLEKERKAERIKEIEEQLVEQERAKREMEAIEKVRVDKDLLAKKVCREAFERSCKIQKAEKEKLKIEAEEYEKLSKTVQESRTKIKQITEARDREAMEKRFEHISNMHWPDANDKRDADLKIIYEKGQETIKQQQEARDKMEQENLSRLKMERVELQKEVTKKLEEDAKHKDEMKKWELLNRFQNVEQNKIFEEEQKKVADEKRKQVKQVWDDHLKVQAQQKKQEKIEMEKYNRLEHVADDAYFFKYADDVKKELQERKMSTYPVEKVVEEYKQLVLKKPAAKKCTQALHLANCKHDLKELICDKPGKIAHCPCKDPNYNRCKCFKNRLFK